MKCPFIKLLSRIQHLRKTHISPNPSLLVLFHYVQLMYIASNSPLLTETVDCNWLSGENDMVDGAILISVCVNVMLYVVRQSKWPDGPADLVGSFRRLHNPTKILQNLTWVYYIITFFFKHLDKKCPWIMNIFE